MSEPDPVDVSNKFLVGKSAGGAIIFLRPLPQQISEADALVLAAFLVSIVGDDEAWTRVLQAVQNS